MIGVLKPLKPVLTRPQTSELLAGTDVDPRPYQIRIVSEVISSLFGDNGAAHDVPARPSTAVLVESPAGSGKTVIGLAVARWFQRNLGGRVGWVAMRRNLLDQAEAENRHRGFDVDLELVSMFEANPSPVDFLVIDEAQHDATRSMAALHARVKPRWVLGLSATPFRIDRVKLCFDRIIREVDIHELIQEGYLSQYHHFTIPEYRPDAVAEIFAREPERWGRSLLFFRRQDQCVECQARLAPCGIKSEVVTACSDRERQIRDFREGRTDVLLSMMILTEGFDCPSIKTVFCRPSSRGCTLQMAGRVLRKHPSIRFKQIVQCRDTRHPFSRTTAP